jgi:putative colanic acid biosynthesis glycosyltransferase
VIVNLTYEDTFPTVNIEALSCGTPVITYRTGGSPECLDAECGSVVECGDIRTIKKEIALVCSEKPYSVAACLNRAVLFDKNRKGEEK